MVSDVVNLHPYTMACILVINCIVLHLPKVVNALQPPEELRHMQEEEAGMRNRLL